MQAGTVSERGQVAIPKDIRQKLNIKTGDLLGFAIEGNKIVLQPVINVPKEQAYFWTKEVQAKIKASEEEFKNGKCKTTTVDELIEELDKRD